MKFKQRWDEKSLSTLFWKKKKRKVSYVFRRGMLETAAVFHFMRFSLPCALCWPHFSRKLTRLQFSRPISWLSRIFTHMCSAHKIRHISRRLKNLFCRMRTCIEGAAWTSRARAEWFIAALLRAFYFFFLFFFIFCRWRFESNVTFKDINLLLSMFFVGYLLLC